MKQSETSRAERLLKLRSEGADFRRNYFLKSKRTWMVVVVIGLLMSFAVGAPEDLALNRSIFCLTGIFIGRIIRDMIWLKDIVDAFPFTEKVINWEKVEEIADQRQIAQPKDQPNPHTSGPVV